MTKFVTFRWRNSSMPQRNCACCGRPAKETRNRGNPARPEGNQRAIRIHGSCPSILIFALTSAFMAGAQLRICGSWARLWTGLRLIGSFLLGHYGEAGAYDARTHLSDLFRKVKAGAVIRITRRWEHVADLVPPESKDKGDATRAATRMDKFMPRREPIANVNTKALINEGQGLCDL